MRMSTYLNEAELKIKEVRLLESIASERTKSITLTIPLTDISENMIISLEDLCAMNIGSHTFKAHIIDPVNRQTLELLSKTKKVNVNDEFVQAIDKMGIAYQLN